MYQLIGSLSRKRIVASFKKSKWNTVAFIEWRLHSREAEIRGLQKVFRLFGAKVGVNDEGEEINNQADCSKISEGKEETKRDSPYWIHNSYSL